MNKKKLFFLFIDALEEGNMCSKFGVQAKMLSSSREGGDEVEKGQANCYVSSSKCGGEA